MRVCLAVDYAHARGVLHRDLKPANIMLGDFGEVYVLDWGVAKLVAGDAAAAPVVVAGEGGRGSRVGTPGYMSPEQLLGLGESQDARTDVYALGAVLFEILTLKPLHRGESFEAAAVREVAEETGLVCELGDELPSTRYLDSKGRLKLVRYWSMRPVGLEPWAPNDEIDGRSWVPVDDAARILTYAHDRTLLRAFTHGDADAG